MENFTFCAVFVRLLPLLCFNMYYKIQIFLWWEFERFYLKSVCFWSFFVPYFLTFELNTEIYSVNLRIQSECGKIRTRKLRMRTLSTQWEAEIWSPFQYKKWYHFLLTHKKIWFVAFMCGLRFVHEIDFSNKLFWIISQNSN